MSKTSASKRTKLQIVAEAFCFIVLIIADMSLFTYSLQWMNTFPLIGVGLIFIGVCINIFYFSLFYKK